MHSYYVNKNEQDNGDHEVHREDCAWLPGANNRVFLGMFNECAPAIASAQSYYEQVNGCYYCCRDCHTG